MPAFRKSNHIAIFLLQKYNQRLLIEALVMKEVIRWTDQSETLLQDTLENADWEMFRMTSADISKFMEVVGSYISLLTNRIIQTVKIKVYPNQKPWVDTALQTAITARTAANNVGLISGGRLSEGSL